MKWILAFAVIAIWSADASSLAPAPADTPDPFGFDLAGPIAPALAGHGCGTAAVNGVFTCSSAPNELSDAQSYMLLEVGGRLAKALAVLETNPNDKTGYKARLRYVELRDALTARYGAPEKEYDFLVAGSIWSGPNDFAMALLVQDRYLASFWTVGPTVILLNVAGEGLSGTYLTLGYEYTPLMEALLEASAAKDAGAL